MSWRLYKDLSTNYITLNPTMQNLGEYTYSYSVLEHSNGDAIIGDKLHNPREITLVSYHVGTPTQTFTTMRLILDYLKNGTFAKLSLRYINAGNYDLPDTGATCYYQLLTPGFGSVRLLELDNNSALIEIGMNCLTPYVIKRTGGTYLAPTGVTEVYTPW